MLASYIKDPDAYLDYGFDWSDWLESGETIITSDWTYDSELFEDSILPDSANDTMTTIWLSGGVEDTDYEVTNHIVTSDGREDDRTITIKVRSR